MTSSLCRTHLLTVSNHISGVMEGIRKSIIHFVWFCDCLLKGELTPLQRHEIQTARGDHLSILDQPSSEIDRCIVDLKRQQRVIEDHWNRLFQNMKIKAYTFLELETFEQFLSKRLREDYVNESFEVSERILNFARIKGDSEDRKIAARNLLEKNEEDVDDYYREVVVSIIEELMIDLAHVERKMRSILARGGKSGSDIQVLVNNCKWADLAVVLVGDRDLAAKISARNGHSSSTHCMIMRGIDQVQRTYFKELVNASTFTISACAKALSAQFNQHSSHSQSSLAIEEDRQPLVTKALDQGVTTRIFGILGSLTGLATRDSFEDEPRPRSDFYYGYNLSPKKTE